MSPVSRREYFANAYKRYQKALFHEKKAILDEVCEVLGYHRKWAIAKLNSGLLRESQRKNKPGPKTIYNLPEIKKPLVEIWKGANLPCSKRLKAVLPLWIRPYEEEFGELETWIKERLKRIAPATLDRVLYGTRIRYRGKGRCTTKPGLLLRTHIPIKVNQWDEKIPGFLEADTVVHCGQSMGGTFVNTVDTVDIATGWTEQRAVFGKGHNDVLDQLKDIESCLPFELLGFDCDNGGEFLNEDVLKYLHNRKRQVQFTRSRAYKKDDNAHIEQKNWTHVRRWLGYRRFENPKITDLLNNLYKKEWRLYQNFFLPSVKLIEKRRVGSRIFRIHSPALTPYQRVFNSKHVKNEVKLALKRQVEALNPFRLKAIINEKIKEIHRLAR